MKNKYQRFSIHLVKKVWSLIFDMVLDKAVLNFSICPAKLYVESANYKVKTSYLLYRYHLIL